MPLLLTMTPRAPLPFLRSPNPCPFTSLRKSYENVRSSSMSAMGQQLHNMTGQIPLDLLINQKEVQVLDKIGTGSFGEVWKALYNGNIVAVKLFVSQESDISSEIKVMAKASGKKNVLELLGVVQSKRDDYSAHQIAIVTPCMSNGSLDDLLVNNNRKDKKNFSTLEIIDFAAQAARGVMSLHVNGIIHRDLACRNFLVNDEMTVFVSDFGFARLREKGMSKGFTATNLGPVRWEAPESLKNKEFSEKTDVFSFGVCLYEMFVGREPFLGRTNAAVAHAVLSGERMRIPIHVDPAVAEIITKCWAPNPSARPSIVLIYEALRHRHVTLQTEEAKVAADIELIGKLKKGARLIKVPFSRSMNFFLIGNKRFFAVSDDLRRICWKQAGNALEKSINLSDIVDIRSGSEVNYSTRSLPKVDMKAGEKNRIAFSLIMEDRSVDIVCPSHDIMDEWVRGLNFLKSRFSEKSGATISLRNCDIDIGQGKDANIGSSELLCLDLLFLVLSSLHLN